MSFSSPALEITPLDYYHVAQSGTDTRKIKVRCPLTWVLTYTDFPPTRLQELLDTKARSIEELQRFVLSYLVMHLAATSDPALRMVFEALHFPLTTSKIAAIRRAADHADRHRHLDDASFGRRS